MSEKAKSIVDIMREKISESGKKKSDIFWVKKDGSIRVRFLSDLTEAICVKFHEQWKVVNPYPCLEYYGKECPGCADDNMKTTERYCLTIWNYETKRVEPFIYKMNNCTPFPAIVSYYGEYDTITDRDYKIEKHGEGTETTYTVIPLTPKKFIGEEVAFTKKQMFKKIFEMFPYTKPMDVKKEKEKYDMDEDEDERPVKKSKVAITDDDDEEDMPKKKMKKPAYDVDDEDEDDIDEDDEDAIDFESMSGAELKEECKKRQLGYKGLTRKQVIKMLEEDMPF